MSISPGTVVADRFMDAEHVSAGGMATVYRAVDQLTGQPVALKVLHRGAEHAIERFAREARLLAELRHPGIVSYITHGQTEGGRFYLVMEWLEGEDLSHLVAHSALSV